MIQRIVCPGFNEPTVIHEISLDREDNIITKTIKLPVGTPLIDVVHYIRTGFSPMTPIFVQASYPDVSDFLTEHGLRVLKG